MLKPTHLAMGAAGVVGTTIVCTLDIGGEKSDVVARVTSFDGSTILFELDSVDLDNVDDDSSE